MSRISAFVSSDKPIDKLLRYLAFLLLYTGALALESALRGPASGVSYALLSAGLVVGAMHLSRARQWPALLATAMLLQTGWLLATDFELSTGWAIVHAAVLIALLAFCGSTPAWLLKGERREMRPNEIFAGCLVTTFLASIALANYCQWVGSVDPTVQGQSFAAALSFDLGIAGVAPLVVVLGMAYGSPRHYDVKRVATILLAFITLLISACVALHQYPASIYALLAPYEFLWIWIALFSGVILAVRASAITSTFALLLMTILGASAFNVAEPQAGRQPESIVRALTEWQSATIAIIVIVLTVAAIVAGRRKEKELDWVRRTIASDILNADAADSDYDSPGRVDALTEALGLAARYCTADACRLYALDQAGRSLHLAHQWPPSTRGNDTRNTPDRLEIGELPALDEALAGGGTTLLRLPPNSDGGQSAPAAALGVRAPVTLLCRPVLSTGLVTGLLVMLKFGTAPVSSRDAEPLMDTIGAFYAGIRLRESTRRSIRDYEQRLRDLAARFAQAEERVRRRTSVELHDGLIQRLAVARMKLGELGQRPETSSHAIGSITTIVDEALGESREIIHNLSPSVLYELGLIPGLQTLCEDLNESGEFDIVMREHGERCHLEEPLRVCIYHVVSELITNSLRHSGGSQVWVDLFWEQSSLDAVVVSDDGKHDDWWLDTATSQATGTLGLLSASERLRPFGFNIKFEQRRGGGTRAIVFWTANASTSW